MESPKRDGMAAAQRLLRAGGTGALAVLEPGAGSPMVTMVNTAVDSGLRPVILISNLSLHTRCLMADPRASLMLHDIFPADGDPQTALRVTLSGRFEKLAEPEEEEAAKAFLTRHPYAELYAGFGDFAFWRLAAEQAHIVAGFGRAYDVRFVDLAAL
ncbi:pyridoxamine 5'-phosphate oxidase family protein [Aestuariivirga sp.]|uniref:pyridoxamine 5'-phosphate oxidase family protein n=1 Tax=Aestuariivirga sp. TaxID=2650926 RepID=UPI0039E5FA65